MGRGRHAVNVSLRTGTHSPSASWDPGCAHTSSASLACAVHGNFTRRLNPVTQLNGAGRVGQEGEGTDLPMASEPSLVRRKSHRTETGRGSFEGERDAPSVADEEKYNRNDSERRTHGENIKGGEIFILGFPVAGRECRVGSVTPFLPEASQAIR